MLRILVATASGEALSELVSALSAHDDVHLWQAESAEAALKAASEKTIDLVITNERIGDKTGLELAADMLSVNPMINFATVSGLTPEKFHEASEGLGIMAQLPAHPGKEDAESLLHRLRQIKTMTGRWNDPGK